MSLIYITGAPGAGKSTLSEVLKEQGYEIHDLDQPIFGGAHNKISGDRVKIPAADKRTPEWFEQHEWRIDRPAFEALKSKAINRDVFICGVAEADTKVIDLFDKIIYLQIDDEVLAKRIVNRTGNDYGKNDFELEEILRRKHKLDEKYRTDDIIRIDANGDIVNTTEKIKQAISKK